MSTAAFAGGYADVLRDIETNSLALASARSAADAERASLHGENLLEGPEAEFGYQWGNRHVPDNKLNYSVSQSFDFPTLYHRRRSLISTEERNASLRYDVLRREVLSQARSKCIAVIYCNRMTAFFDRHLAHSEALAEAYRRLMEQGGATVLESGKAALAVAGVRASKSRVEAERTSLLASLQAMNGGVPVELNDTVFPVFDLPADAEAYCAAAMANAPELRLADGEAAAAGRKAGVEKAASLPRLSLGYTGEKQGADMLQGIAVGVALPLWSNSSRVRAAKAADVSAQLQAADARTEAEYRLRAIYNTAVTNARIAVEYEQAIVDADYGRWLAKALEMRNISVTDYIQELGVLCDAVESLEQARRDAAEAGAEAASYIINY